MSTKLWKPPSITHRANAYVKKLGRLSDAEKLEWFDNIVGAAFRKGYSVRKGDERKMRSADVGQLRIPRTWFAIDYAPHDRRLLVKSESGEIYAAHWVQNPFTGDEAWLVSEAPDGTQHLVKAIEWREI